MTRRRFAALPVAAALLGGCAAGVSRPYSLTPAPAACEHIAGEVENRLTQNVLPAWLPRTIDREQGGFCANFDRNWRPLPGNPKSIVYQARVTWVAATAAMAWPAQAEMYRQAALHGAKFLAERLWDAANGGFYWQLPAFAEAPSRRDTEKHLYGNAFGIYALARVYRATGDEAARRLAIETFRWWETHAHDPAHGGYVEALTAEGRAIPAAAGPLPDRLDAIGTLYGYKSMNSHIHMLEALTELYRVWPDAAVKARLEEMLAIVRDRVTVEPGCLNQFFTPDWRPLPYPDSFGHDVETAYLILEAAEALGRADDERTWLVARQLIDHALDYGWDHEHGGFFYEGTATSGELNQRKEWWVQAEGLNALLLMQERFGRQSDRYWLAFIEQWAFIDAYLIDHAGGGWYTATGPDGRLLNDRKASVWKAPYHTVRAMLNVTRRLRLLAARSVLVEATDQRSAGTKRQEAARRSADRARLTR